MGPGDKFKSKRAAAFHSLSYGLAAGLPTGRWNKTRKSRIPLFFTDCAAVLSKDEMACERVNLILLRAKYYKSRDEKRISVWASEVESGLTIHHAPGIKVMDNIVLSHSGIKEAVYGERGSFFSQRGATAVIFFKENNSNVSLALTGGWFVCSLY